MNVSLRQLRAFIALARTGSFTQAAESLHVTQSALSGLIKELEQALGLRLFDRNTRHTQLSEVGAALYPLIEQILQDLDGVLDEVSNLKALKKGLVRVAAPQLMASTLLPTVIADFKQHFPDIEIRLLDTAVENVTAKVLSGEVDIGVGPERDPHSDLETALLFELPFHLVLPTTHPLASQDTIPWADLVTLPVITLQGQFTERLSLDLNATMREVDITPATTVTFMSTALSMVAAGLGVTICMPYAESLVQLYGMTMRPLTSPEVRRRFQLFTRAGRSLPPAAKRFHAHLLAHHHGAGQAPP
ncbi:MAG: LysR family transcriptional regulator [Lautropia sp.]|nr:LysR family transcriptional regulator [Lautropia sp.]